MRSNRIAAPDLRGAVWKKSSFSGSNQGQCVEIADVTAAHDTIAIRDSKNPEGPALLFSPAAFSSFITDVAAGHFDA